MAARSVLLVEGKDDQELIRHLLNHYDLGRAFGVEARNGVAQLLNDLPREFKASDLRHLGVIVDADSRLLGRWERLAQILKDRGYQVRPEPDPYGTLIAAEGEPSVGIWLMPDNKREGTIEDFTRLLIPADDRLLARADGCVDSIPQEQRRFGSQRSKAVIHTWLAWQAEPGQPMGLAVTKKFLQADSETGQSFISWVRRLLDS